MKYTMSDDLTTDEWLEQISYQLHKQNQLLATLVEQPDESNTKQYACELCNQTVAKDDREAHLSQSHNPPSGVDIDKRFSKI